MQIARYVVHSYSRSCTMETYLFFHLDVQALVQALKRLRKEFVELDVATPVYASLAISLAKHVCVGVLRKGLYSRPGEHYAARPPPAAVYESLQRH